MKIRQDDVSKFDIDISKISIFPSAKRYDTKYRYRIDITIFRYIEAALVRTETETKVNKNKNV